MSLLSRLRLSRPGESGSVAVEFALIGMILILLCVGIVEIGRALHLRNQLSHAVDHASRLILLDVDIPAGDVGVAIRDRFDGDGTLLQIADASATVDGIDFRTLEVGYPLSLSIPGLSGDTITIRLRRRIPRP